jgi:hypothetical protein
MGLEVSRQLRTVGLKMEELVVVGEHGHDVIFVLLPANIGVITVRVIA